MPKADFAIDPTVSGRRLILFGRYPVPGQTKTRLIPTLGTLGAADFQRWLTEKTLATLLKAALAPVEMCYTGGRLSQLQRWLGQYQVRLTPQANGDLGLRMQAAITDVLIRGHRQVVLVGSDLPHLEAGHLAAAFEALADHDLVLVPTLDGGYGLVGCRRPIDIFKPIAWGTPQVLEQTLSLARRQGLSVKQLDPLRDLDTETDLMAWQPDRRWQRPYLSVIIPAVNEQAHIEQAVARVRSVETQILVVDGGSQDKTAVLADQAGAIVVPSPRGRAVQQNLGAAQAQGRVLVFVHADTCLPVDFGARIFELLMAPDILAGAFRFKTDLNHWTMRLIEKAVQIRSALLHLPYGDQALFMRKAVFDQADGFPQVPVAEDLLLMRRLARMGRIGIVPAPAVTSGRRWRQLGIVRTTLINHLIAAGCLAGVAPRRLAPLYRRKKLIRELTQTTP